MHHVRVQNTAQQRFAFARDTRQVDAPKGKDAVESGYTDEETRPTPPPPLPVTDAPYPSTPSAHD